MTTEPSYLQPIVIGTVHDGWVEIDSVSTDDAEFVAEAESLESAAAIGAIGQEVFDLGLTVRRLAHTDAEVARISDELTAYDQAVQSLTDKASLILREQVEAVLDADIGFQSRDTSGATDELRAAIRQALDTNDRQRATRLLVDELTAQNSRAVGQAIRDVRALLDPSREDSPLATMRRELINEFSGPLHQMTEQLTAVHAMSVDRASRPRTPTDGVPYEVLVGEILNEAATVSGDHVTTASADTGIDTSRAGGFVVDVSDGAGHAGRFVVERETSQLGRKAMLQHLDDAAESRGAAAAILVTASADYGWKKQPLQKVGPRRYVVVAEPDDLSQLALRVAYQMARADVVAGLADSEGGTGLDLVALRAHLEQARTHLDATSTIKEVLTSAEKEIARAKATLQTMRASIEELLSEIQDELEPTD